MVQVIIVDENLVSCYCITFFILKADFPECFKCSLAGYAAFENLKTSQVHSVRSIQVLDRHGKREEQDTILNLS